MKPRHVLIVLALIHLMIGCTPEVKEQEQFDIDHLLVWVEDPTAMKSKVEDLGFVAVPDSISDAHEGQGTAGKYFNFLNCYVELIYVNDEAAFQKNNEMNSSLDFEERRNHKSNGFSPFGVALKMKEYAPSSIPFSTIKYHQMWMGEDHNIYAASTSKINKQEPTTFIVYPEIEAEVFEDEESLTRIPKEYDFWRKTYEHKNGAEKITKLVYTLKQTDKKSNTLKELENLSMIEFEQGDEYLLEIYFDHHRQKETFDLRPDLPIKIYI